MASYKFQDYNFRVTNNKFFKIYSRENHSNIVYEVDMDSNPEVRVDIDNDDIIPHNAWLEVEVDRVLDTVGLSGNAVRVNTSGDLLDIEDEPVTVVNEKVGLKIINDELQVSILREAEE